MNQLATVKPQYSFPHGLARLLLLVPAVVCPRCDRAVELAVRDEAKPDEAACLGCWGPPRSQLSAGAPS